MEYAEALFWARKDIEMAKARIENALKDLQAVDDRLRRLERRE